MPVSYNPERKSSKFNPKRLLWFIGVGIVLGGILSLFIRGFIYKPILIESRAMEPTLKYGSSYMLQKWKKNYLIGDIVLCERDTGVIVSRIVGKPGDLIEIREKTLIRNGDPIPKNLYPAQWIDERPPLPLELTSRDQMPEMRVPDNHFFLLGDNRDYSSDSRNLGSMPRECLLGTFSEGN
jgi:signal peptidase I